YTGCEDRDLGRARPPLAGRGALGKSARPWVRCTMTRPARSPIPQGVATFLPVEAGEKRAVEDVVFSVFREHGYREVIPPTFEYLDILAPGLDTELIEKSYKVVDRATGRILVVRPDVTAQIAR